jgi:4-hydroxythreonine-4-phosphate dehydrogenase
MEKESNPKEERTNLPIIGITLGDFNGIGPEVIIKTLQDNRILKYCKIVLYASNGILSKYRQLLKADDFQWNTCQSFEQLHPKKVNLINCWAEDYSLSLGKSTPEAGICAYLALDKAANDLKDGLIHAIVTGPINKANMPFELFPFPGQTEFFEQRFSTSGSLMLLVNNNLRVGVATGHIPIGKVVSDLSPKILSFKLSVLHYSLIHDFGIQKPKIAVLGLNPHAGEDGKLGTEEKNLIEPLIKDLKNKGQLVFGPYPADGFFGSRMQNNYDGILAMYHDQGLIPFKALAFDSGVNYTAGLNAIRTSPDHGTAYNIAGKNQASPDSFRSALFLACDLVKQRKKDLKLN